MENNKYLAINALRKTQKRDASTPPNDADDTRSANRNLPPSPPPQKTVNETNTSTTLVNAVTICPTTDSIYERIMWARRAAALTPPPPYPTNRSATTPLFHPPPPFPLLQTTANEARTTSINATTTIRPTRHDIYEQIMRARRAAALKPPPPYPTNKSATTTTTTDTLQESETEESANMYRHKIASRRMTAKISTRETNAPPISNRKTMWRYNEDEDEEELYGFKKAFFFNNDDFYSRYR